MCGECCGQCRGWCRSFTNTEILLSLLEAFLLIVFIAFLTITVLHFIACSKKEIDESTYPDDGKKYPEDKEREQFPPTAAPGVKCTWKPKQKTKAVTHYYEQSGVANVTQPTASTYARFTEVTSSSSKHSIVEDMLPYLTDGEDAESYKQYVLALVKLRPPQDITFGCILTVVAEQWAVTAASCVEAIEEVDALDAFVMMEEYGEPRAGRTHAVADVFVHPWYQGTNHSYDFVALKSENSLVKGSKSAIEIASALDFFLTPIGEMFTIIGYGGYRSMEGGAAGRGARVVRAWLAPARRCAAAGWAPRHLARPRPAAGAACAARRLCAGARAARGAPCNYCAGTPLLLAGRLLGVMSDNPQCGAACEPVLYANAPLLRPWLDALRAGGDDLLL